MSSRESDYGSDLQGSSTSSSVADSSPFMFDVLSEEQHRNMSITPPVEDLAPTSMNMLDDKLASNLRQMDYVDLLPLQEYATSVLLSERSLVVSAPTGSGKTAAYLIPTIEYVIRYRKSKGMAKGPLVLILSNTKSVLFHTFYTACTMAGCRQNPEVARCKVGIYDLFSGKRISQLATVNSIKHDIIVASCAGVLTALNNMKLNLTKLKMLVIDEVDMMIDEHLGLWYGLNKILEKIPGDTTIAGFSAAYCDESNLSFVSQLQVKLFRHAVPILINVAAPKGYITQRVLEKGRQLPEHPYWEPDFAKDLGFLVGMISRDLELHHMRKGGPYEKSTVIFAKNNKTSNYLAIYLQLMGYHFEPFNSDFIVADNQETIKRLKRGEIQGIVSSNKLVRAVDIPEVDHIIFYDMVENFNDYKHRIGRTGTMGRGGRATVMLSMNADRNLIIPLVEFMNYHRQILPCWLWESYQDALNRPEQEAPSFSDSFVTAPSEVSSIGMVSDNEQFVSLRRNSLP